MQGSEPEKKRAFELGLDLKISDFYGFGLGIGFEIFRFFRFGSVFLGFGSKLESLPENPKNPKSETQKCEILKSKPNPKTRFFRVRTPN